ncbi:MAG TPA: hypothetical protein VKF62_03385 [Planctomycetota bacterium]|nr:hypothetical protein [Planctomycetota bacterium]
MAAPRSSALVLLAGLLSLAMASACASSGETAAVEPARLYARSCALCHPLRRPEAYPGAAWAANVRRYGARAGLSPRERETVLRYLQEHASDAPGRGASGS